MVNHYWWHIIENSKDLVSLLTSNTTHFSNIKRCHIEMSAETDIGSYLGRNSGDICSGQDQAGTRAHTCK